jgi:hypothetical protein
MNTLNIKDCIVLNYTVYIILNRCNTVQLPDIPVNPKKLFAA